MPVGADYSTNARSVADAGMAMRFEDLLSEMSSTFVRIPPDQIDGEIDRWLQRLGLELGVDRVSVGLLDADSRNLYVTCQWTREGIRPIPSGLEVQAALPWLAAKVIAGEPVVVSCEEELPPEASKDLEWIRRVGFKSNVTIPFRVGGVVVGGVAFGTVLHQRRWSRRTIRRLRLIAEIFGSAVQRSRTAAEIRRLEKELRRCSSVTMMGELAASLAHELNQPLSAILSNAQAAHHLLDARTPNLAEARAALDDIIRDNTRAVEIIRSVRSLFQRAETKPSTLDPKQVLLEVERMLRPDAITRNISLRLELPASLPTVAGNRTELMQALMNLVVNAFDAVSEATDGAREVAVGAARRETGRVHVWVRDSGKGIDPKIMPRLFQAFVTTKPKGMGMGLAIARSVVEKHGGQLWATQNSDRGTTMEFYLPTQRRTAKSEAA